MFSAIRAFQRKHFYTWFDTTANQPSPGAEAMAFGSLMLPIYEWDGPGEPVMSQINAGSAPVVVQQMVVPTGIAGIAAGQMFQTPLGENPSEGPL